MTAPTRRLDEITLRPPPHNLGSEEAVLGAMLLSADAITDALQVGLGAEDFYKPAHSHLFDAITSLHHQGIPPDVGLVAEQLARRGLLERVGGPQGLVTMQAAGVPSIVRHHARLVAECAWLRRVLGLAGQLTELAYDRQPEAVAEVVGELAGFTAAGVAVPQVADPSVLDWPTFWAEDTGGGEWLVEPILPAGRQVAVFATAKAGKSLLALEVAAARATGRTVIDQPAGEASRVVYLDYEQSADDLRDRLTDLGYGPGDDLGGLTYYLLPTLPPLDTKEGGEAMAAILERHRPDLVVIDTMARAVEGDENLADTLRGFYRHTGSRLKGAGVTLLRLDHAGKDPAKGQRGTSAKTEDVDVVFKLVAEGNRVSLRRTHSRVPWVPDHLALVRDEEPYLRHRLLPPDAWPAGTADVAETLEALSVPLDVSLRTALVELKKAGHGRRRTVVAAALKYRRERP